MTETTFLISKTKLSTYSIVDLITHRTEGYADHVVKRGWKHKTIIYCCGLINNNLCFLIFKYYHLITNSNRAVARREGDTKSKFRV